VTLTFSPPNSDAVVNPTGLAPPSWMKRRVVSEVKDATWSLNTSDAPVSGHPCTCSSSLMPTGTPPNGLVRSACRAAANARSGSRNEKQFRSLAAIASSVAWSSSAGDRSPARNASTREHASPSQGPSEDAEAEGAPSVVTAMGSMVPQGPNRIHPGSGWSPVTVTDRGLNGPHATSDRTVRRWVRPRGHRGPRHEGAGRVVHGVLAVGHHVAGHPRRARRAQAGAAPHPARHGRHG